MNTEARLRLAHAEIETLREQVAMLKAALAVEGFDPPREWGLTVTEKRIFCALVARPKVSRNALHALVYGDRPYADAADERIFDVFVCKIRRKLKPFGIVIGTVWGEGWCLDSALRASLLQPMREAA